MDIKNKYYKRFLDDHKFRYMVDVIIRSTIEDKARINDWEEAIQYLKQCTLFK